MTPAPLISRTYYYDRDYGYTKSWLKGQNLSLTSQALPQPAWLIPGPSPSLQPTLRFPTHLHSRLVSILDYVLPLPWGHPRPPRSDSHRDPVRESQTSNKTRKRSSGRGLPFPEWAKHHANYFPNVISFKACNHPLKKALLLYM